MALLRLSFRFTFLLFWLVLVSEIRQYVRCFSFQLHKFVKNRGVGDPLNNIIKGWRLLNFLLSGVTNFGILFLVLKPISLTNIRIIMKDVDLSAHTGHVLESLK